MEFDVTPRPLYRVSQPKWSSHAVIYQVNTRQFSTKGTFDGVTESLEHIKSLGADIIWLMPIHPIGKKTEKGSSVAPTRSVIISM